MRVLVTGAAGFIGAALSERLLARGDEVVGVDNLNDYYDVRLKEARLARLTPHAGFRFVQRSTRGSRRHWSRRSPSSDRSAWSTSPRRPACATRWRIRTPTSKATSSASSTSSKAAGTAASSTWSTPRRVRSTARNRKLPFSVHDSVDHPVSLYAATKKANELMAHTYSHLFGLPTTGLRFFTVYGPWGRPDMALFLFTRKILAGEPIEVFNHGQHTRDFTYIDDIVEGVDPHARPRRRAGDPGLRRAGPESRHVGARRTGSTTSATTSRSSCARYIEVLERMPRPQGREDPAAAAARRRARHLRRRRGARRATPAMRRRRRSKSASARFVDWYRESVSLSMA